MVTKVRTAGIAMLSVAAVVGMTGTADAASAAKTSISIQGQEGGFFGQVSSSKESCANGRKVVLYRVKGKKQTKVGTDIAQPNGDGFMWSINVSQSGRFVAKAAAKSGCKAGQSK